MTTKVQALPRLDPHLIYWLDAIGSLAMGLALLVSADALTGLAGWALPAAFLWTIGLLLVPWATYNAWIARTSAPARSLVLGNIAGDIAWVLGSLALIVLHAASLSPAGLALLAGQGVAVAAVLALKLLGARSLLA